MSKLFKTASGVIFDEHFKSLSNDYLINDVSKVLTTEDGLQINHSNTADIRLLRDIPKNMAATEIYIDYTPRLEHDKGGFLLFDGSGQVAELLEFKDDAFDSLTTIKVTKDGNVYDFFMKHIQFLHIDSVTHTFTKMGFVAKRGQTDFEPLLINRWLCTTSEIFTVRNLEAGMYVELATPETTYTAMADTLSGLAHINFNRLHVNGKLMVKDSEGTLIESLEGDFFAGDEYTLGSYLIVRKDSIDLDTLIPKELGRLARNTIEVQMELHNPSLTATAHDVELAVAKYHSLFGHEWASIAWDVAGEPSDYRTTLRAFTLSPMESKYFWIKLERAEVSTTDSVFYFTIDITHQ